MREIIAKYPVIDIFDLVSDGTYIPSINAFQSAPQKLAKLQRQLSRKVKFSNNWYKLLKKIQKLHWHIANMREDYLHKSSYTLSKNHAIVCIEDLSVTNMPRPSLIKRSL